MEYKHTSVICVYIAEAHACDEWPLGNFECVKKPKTQEERIAAAQYFVDKYGLKIPVLVDNMDNAFDNVFAAWPERWFLLHKSMTVLDVGFPTTEFGYDRGQVEEILQEFEKTC